MFQHSELWQEEAYLILVQVLLTPHLSHYADKALLTSTEPQGTYKSVLIIKLETLV